MTSGRPHLEDALLSPCTHTTQVFTPFKNNLKIHSKTGSIWIEAHTYITCMHGHTWEAIITDTHTHTHTKTAEHTWLLGSHPDTLCSHSILNHWRSHSHTHTHKSMAGVTFISALKQWIYENVVLRLLAFGCVWSCVCVPFSQCTATDWDSSSCMIKHRLYTRTQADIREPKSNLTLGTWKFWMSTDLVLSTRAVEIGLEWHLNICS